MADDEEATLGSHMLDLSDIGGKGDSAGNGRAGRGEAEETPLKVEEDGRSDLADLSAGAGARRKKGGKSESGHSRGSATPASKPPSPAPSAQADAVRVTANMEKVVSADQTPTRTSYEAARPNRSPTGRGNLKVDLRPPSVPTHIPTQSARTAGVRNTPISPPRRASYQVRTPAENRYLSHKHYGAFQKMASGQSLLDGKSFWRSILSGDRLPQPANRLESCRAVGAKRKGVR
ncbi:uncharacterized protein EV422DRAFT_337673 [Fimicolochytrium jonesii]|uniref:uncharacterized protein n=1 Tax=Fimicolochytrium jonesii TaxID=1396493 RepID=UPI0022FE39E6|nr:uncharacterized protein EV422DRAFT_337673 [Fimicolochytrium jonesii]KAI8815970.1 hypothetical protein EV422DRAFT_337673 [Fimicolochytrium jonesii]